MRRRNPSLLNLRDLRIPFLLDFVHRKTPSRDAQQQTLRPTFQLSRFVQQPPNAQGSSRRRTVAQIQMHSDTKFRMTSVHRNPRFKRAPVRQQGSAGDQSAPVRLRNPAIDSFGPAQVVGIHYQILSTYAHPCPFGQLLFRITNHIRTIDRLSL